MAEFTWTPSRPGGLPRDTPLDDRAGETGLPWDQAPADSHLWGFRFYDARKFNFVRRWGPEETRGQSQLHVRFKSESGRPMSEYWYYFTDHDAGADYYARMKAAESPGEIIQELIAARVTYRKQGQFA